MKENVENGWMFSIHRKVVKVRLFYKPTLQSLALSVYIKHIKRIRNKDEAIEEMVQLKELLGRIGHSELNLGQIAQFYLDTRSHDNWRLLCVAGGRCPWPNITRCITL